MNKQEVIEEIRIRSKYDSEYRTSLIRSDQAIELIKKIDESESRHLDQPQKVKVKQFVADWYEEHKGDLEFSIWKLTIESNDNYTSDRSKMRNWIQYAPIKPYETLLSMKNGYEVEEEQLYQVIINGDYLIKLFDNRNDHKFVGKEDLVIWLPSGYQLTEAEIKAIDERYWSFAVPAEKVEV